MKVLDSLKNEVKKRMQNDSAHDFEHTIRVYKNAQKICKKEKANEKLVLSAALLHDVVSYPKSDINVQAKYIDKCIVNGIDYGIDKVINRIIDNTSVAVASLNRKPVVSSREMALSHQKKNCAVRIILYKRIFPPKKFLQNIFLL